VDANAAWTLAGRLTILNGASLTDTGALENDGAIALDPSMLTIGGLTGTASVAIGAGSTLEAQATVSSGETIRFAGSNAYLRFDMPDGVAGHVTNFGLGENATNRRGSWPIRRRSEPFPRRCFEIEARSIPHTSNKTLANWRIVAFIIIMRYLKRSRDHFVLGKLNHGVGYRPAGWLVPGACPSTVLCA
jgi:hypothetical protein